MNSNRYSNPAKRLCLPDFDGKLFTLDSSPGAWQCLNPDSRNADLLLLGTGPEKAEALPFVQAALEKKRKIYWLEEPGLKKRYSQFSLYSFPPNDWQEIEKSEAEKIAQKAKVFFYKPGLRLVPDFWQTILGKIAIASAGIDPRKKATSNSLRVWLPGNDRQLLWPELARTLTEMGAKINSNEFKEIDCLNPASLWQNQWPDLAISVNFRGLDSNGHIASLCNALNIPLAIWLVDNPWNLLSAIRLPWWKQTRLFVTDASFIKELKAYGAQHVEYCPLAAAPHMQRSLQIKTLTAPLFVGRSSFPDKKSFFSGLRVPDCLASMAEKELAASKKPDFHWWVKKNPVKLWPGKQGRLPAFCADTFSANNRANWIRKTPDNLRIIGDEDWKQLLPDRKVLPMVDYYGSLADYYRNSIATLNVTSWLLPESLNQRHFDVWAAGGFLLTDYSEGLKLFPDEISKEIILYHPEEFAEKLDYFQKRPRQAQDLRMAWREELNKAHLYRHRVEKIMKTLGVPIPEN